MSWWSHSQQAPVIGAKVAADQALTLHKSSLCTNLWRRLGRELWPGSSVHAEVNRDLFGTCHFTQERTEDGRRRRLVRKATLGEGQAGQISDTGEWLSRRPVIPRSLTSNASAVAMRELLATSDEETHPHDVDEDYAIGWRSSAKEADAKAIAAADGSRALARTYARSNVHASPSHMTSAFGTSLLC
ncbi:hypothetical protein AK812_SmicGene21023 [Symbiodinium microadriaticum]|uniref:Uncharacterized protein n=1 Tax=Symbiodinium microadriaticum TaxID=2951 RepID=A0A1Q9DNK3_SYMMI|nr:hypothetical protein AK812_SmicGene21023 [Symbiodinium microadriaticum]